MRNRTAVLLALVSATVVGLAFTGLAAAAQVSTYVGCTDLGQAAPSHECEIGDFPGAFFKADEEIEYDVCVEFPSELFLCAEEQLAFAGTLYVNPITTDQVGRHYVDWYLSGTEELLGSWTFDLKEPPKPAPVAVLPPPLPVPAISAPVPTGPSKACLKARKRTKVLSGRLSTAGKKQKASIRKKLKMSRAKAKKRC